MARGLRRYQCKGCGRTFNALSGTPLSGLHHKGTLAVVRGVAGEGGDGEGVGGALRRGGEHGVPLASPVSGGGAKRFGGAQGDRGSGRDLRPGEPEGRARAGAQGTAAGRQGEEAAASRASRYRFSWRRTGAERRSARVLPRVDAAALTAALDPVVAKDALLVSDGGASYPPCAAALGVSHEALNRSMGERVRGDLHVQTVNSRHSRLKDFLRPRRGFATRYLDNYLSWFHLVGLAPGANDRACLAAAITR